ncbi:uncharacterized protein ACHE_70267S [Aspergillus chevalieri]|uniref:Uncharacterized protein n=1 Tax=Aspergillus chevalieri TaxID=182096 RepID=A0A7R7VV80_ASPCH|nr:uncharacterized protein ACHE_70267S [Aspergillus chevalieri]BCR91424.1 hypothetical protein ACHE_70267S [Aspergillus chevalieri]
MATFQIPPPRNDDYQAISRLMKTTSEQENRSRQYQGLLESRIREEQATNRQISDRCTWLESIIRKTNEYCTEIS